MKTSDNIDQIATALAAAQAAMPNAAFNRINPHFKSQYADLAAIREATLPALTKNGLSIVQATCLTAVGFVLFSRLMHKSGQWIEAEYPITLGTPQSMGSQLTYGRRYLWSALTGVAADEDDDAEVAETEVKEAKPKMTAHAARKNLIWEDLKAEMDGIDDAHRLKTWATANYQRIHSMPDSWVRNFREVYEIKQTELKEGVKEDGTRAKKTTAEEIDDEMPEAGGSET
jgi:hypothetical protein